MKKSKGFTLIELLAVIIVLAVIALIAVPVLLKVIDSTKKGALKDSAYGLIESASLYLANNLGKIAETTEFKCNGNICIEYVCEEDECETLENGKEINYKGTIDNGRIKVYEDGKVSICIENKKYAALKLSNEQEVTVNEGNCNYINDEYEIDEVVSLEKYEELKDELEKLKSKGNAEASHILKDKTAVVKGEEITGTMANQGAKTLSLNAGGSYTIPEGYHNGLGVITANSLSSQTSATATAAQILTGQTAWVNGSKITGTMANLSNTIQTATTSTSDRTKSAYKWDSGIVIAPGNGYWGNWDWNTSAIKIPAANFGGAAASSVLSGQTFTSSNGMKITGSMVNRGAVTSTINPGGSYTIPAGYHNGSGKITAASCDSGNITKVATTPKPSLSGWGQSSSVTVDLTGVSGYKNLTKSNIILKIKSLGYYVKNSYKSLGSEADRWNGLINISYSYNASTGILTISNVGRADYLEGTGSTPIYAWVILDVYVIK